MTGNAVLRELGIVAAVQVVVLLFGALVVLVVPPGRPLMESQHRSGAIGPIRAAVVVEASAVAEAAAVVSITDTLKYEPASVTIKVGEIVAWKNVSMLRHTATADPSKAAVASHVMVPSADAAFNSDLIEPGSVYQHKFDIPGKYRYFCIPHEATGMTGEIIVEAQ